MTTIAFDGKTLAADRLRTMRGVPMTATKVFRARHWKLHGSEALYGCAGDSYEIVALREWLQGAGEKPTLKDISILAMDRDCQAWLGNESFAFVPVTLPIFGIGTGGEYAMGAMAAGKCAADAVKIAETLDNCTGLGIDILEWNPEEKRA
jgi:hypothetical protein